MYSRGSPSFGKSIAYLQRGFPLTIFDVFLPHREMAGSREGIQGFYRKFPGFANPQWQQKSTAGGQCLAGRYRVLPLPLGEGPRRGGEGLSLGALAPQVMERILQPVLKGNLNLFAHTAKIPVNIPVGKS